MKIVIDSVEQGGDQWRVALTVTAGDGTATRMLHVFPLDTMEWRAAEYGIDPSDTATLLDIVLTEPHLTPEEWATGSQLYDAPNVATAQAHHLTRCAQAKLRCRMSTRAIGGPLAPVRTASPMDAEVLAVKREHVALARERCAEQNRKSVAVGPRSGVERAAALRVRLAASVADRPDLPFDVQHRNAGI